MPADDWTARSKRAEVVEENVRTFPMQPSHAPTANASIHAPDHTRIATGTPRMAANPTLTRTSLTAEGAGMRADDRPTPLTQYVRTADVVTIDA